MTELVNNSTAFCNLIISFPQIASYLDYADTNSLLRVSKATEETIKYLKDNGTIPHYLSEYSANKSETPPSGIDMKLIDCARKSWGNKFIKKKIFTLGFPLGEGRYFITPSGPDSFLFRRLPYLFQNSTKVASIKKGAEMEFRIKRKGSIETKMENVDKIERFKDRISVVRNNPPASSLVLMEPHDLLEKVAIPLNRIPVFSFSSPNYVVLLFEENGHYELAVHKMGNDEPEGTTKIHLVGEILGGTIIEGELEVKLFVWGNFGVHSHSLSSGETINVYDEPVTQFVEFDQCCYLINDQKKLVRVSFSDKEAGIGYRKLKQYNCVEKLTKIGADELLVEAKYEMFLISTNETIKAKGIKEEKKHWTSSAACMGGGFLVLGINKKIKLYRLEEIEKRPSKISFLDSWFIDIAGTIQSLFFLKNGILIGRTNRGVIFNLSPFKSFETG